MRSFESCGVARRVVAACSVLMVFALGCQSGPPNLPPPRVVGDTDDYVIGVPDVMRIHVWKQPEISAEVVVRPDGKISLPLLQDVQAEGLTAEQLQEELVRRFSDFIVAPQVNVIVTEMRSYSASIVGGGIARSGVLPLSRQTRVLDAIAQMGGFTPFAKKSDIRVLRQVDNLQVEYRFDYDAFIKGKAPDTNMLLEPGDTVVVPD